MKKWLTFFIIQHLTKRALRNPAAAARDIKRFAIGALLASVALFVVTILLVFRLFGWLATTFPVVGTLFSILGLAALLLISYNVINMLWRVSMFKNHRNAAQPPHTPDGVIDVTNITTREKKK